MGSLNASESQSMIREDKEREHVPGRLDRRDRFSSDKLNCTRCCREPGRHGKSYAYILCGLPKRKEGEKKKNEKEKATSKIQPTKPRLGWSGCMRLHLTVKNHHPDLN